MIQTSSITSCSKLSVMGLVLLFSLSSAMGAISLAQVDPGSEDVSSAGSRLSSLEAFCAAVQAVKELSAGVRDGVQLYGDGSDIRTLGKGATWSPYRSKFGSEVFPPGEHIDAVALRGKRPRFVKRSAVVDTVHD